MILKVTLLNLGIAVLSCLVVAFLLMPSLIAVTMVALAISSICVGVIGFMTFWGVSLDSISMINIVLCIGFSVDFSAHICYHFSASDTFTDPAGPSDVSDGDYKLNNLNENDDIRKSSDHIMNNASHDIPVDYPTGTLRAHRALTQLGLPIIQGALSTILAVSILSASNTYIFRTFFKVIFLVMCFGFYHAMAVLPVVLAMFTDLCCCGH